MAEERAVTAVDKRLGQRVRARRLELGMAQETLAELLGVTFQQVQKYEKGVNRISASRLFEIASALDVPISRFFEGLTPKRGPSPVEQNSRNDDVLATPEGSQLFAMFASITNRKVRQRIVELVRALSVAEKD